MKNLVLIFSFGFVTMIALSAKGQTTSLEFNQVILVSSAQTVPTGKVWKIEGVFYSSTIPDPLCTSSSSCYSITPLNDAIIVGGTNTIIRSLNSRGTYSSVSSVLWEEHFPMWLSAGTSLAAGSGVNKISVIEFNILP